MSLETRSGFTENHKEFGLHIRSNAATERSAEPIANLIALEANARAASQDPATREAKKGKSRRIKTLRGSYSARRDGNLRVGRNSRAIWVVETNVLEAATQEFGTETQRPRYPLLRAAMTVIHAELPGGANIRPPQNTEIISE